MDFKLGHYRPVWDRAKRIAELKNDNISSIIIVRLRQYISENEGLAGKIEALLNGANNGT